MQGGGWGMRPTSSSTELTRCEHPPPCRIQPLGSERVCGQERRVKAWMDAHNAECWEAQRLWEELRELPPEKAMEPGFIFCSRYTAERAVQQGDTHHL